MISIVFNIMLSLFIICTIGYIARKFNIIDTVLSKRLSDFVIKIAQPFLICSAVIKAEYSKDNLILGFTILGVGLLSHTILAVIARLYAKPIKDFNESKITEFAMIFSNCGYMGLPVVNELLGPQGTFCCAFYIIAFNLFTWSYGMVLLGRGRDDIKMNLKNALLNFGTTPCLIGLVLYVLKPFFELPDFVMKAVDYLGSLCTPITLLITGGLIATRPLLKFLANYKIYIFSFVKLLVIPSLAAFICNILGMNPFMTTFITVMTGLPCAANATMFGELYDIEPEYAAQLVGITTVLSVLTIPVTVFISEFIAKI